MHIHTFISINIHILNDNMTGKIHEYCVQYILYNVQNTKYKVQNTKYKVQCTMYIVLIENTRLYLCNKYYEREIFLPVDIVTVYLYLYL